MSILIIIVLLLLWWFYRSKEEQRDRQKVEQEHAQKIAELDEIKSSIEERERKVKIREDKAKEKENNFKKLNEQAKAVDDRIKEKNTELDGLQKEINGLYDKNLVKTYDSLIVPNISEISSAEIKNELSMLKVAEKELIEHGGLSLPSWLEKRERTNLKKKMLLPLESEVAGLLNKLTIANIDTTRNKIIHSFERINKLFEPDNSEFTNKMLEHELKKLELNYSYIVKVNDEKEQQKAIKEQMIDEEKAQKEIQKEKKRIDKESRQFNNELKKMLKYLSNSSDSVQSEIYSDKIKELEDQIAQLEVDKKDVEHRASNTRAGFVYVISNVGSFGNDVYKIGMTKRFNPMDRIKELSSASVPFEFDVHATIFSDDAPSLETKLHNRFSDKAVNKVNSRKEFYKVPLRKIEDAVINEFDATIEFTELAKAEEYRRSMEIVKKAV